MEREREIIRSLMLGTARVSLVAGFFFFFFNRKSKIEYGKKGDNKKQTKKR